MATFTTPPVVAAGGLIRSADITAIGQNTQLLKDLSLRYRSQRVVVVGDSVDQASDTPLYLGGSIWSDTAAFSNRRLNLVANVAVGGRSTTVMLSNFDAEVPQWKPTIVITGGATNDISGGVATATTRANIITIVAKIRALGAVPVLRTTPPTDNADGFSSVALHRAAVDLHNGWIRRYADSEDIALVDIYRYLVNPTNSGYKAGLTDDGVHPNAVASKSIVTALVAGDLPLIFRGTTALALSNVDPENLVANGLALKDDNVDGVPDSWYLPTPSQWSLSDAAFGKWVTATTTGSQVTGYSPTTAAGAFVTGDRLAFSCRFKKSDGVDGSIQVYDQNYAGKLTMAGPKAGKVFGDSALYMEYVVPAGITALGFSITAATSAGTVSASQLTIRNLTALGLA